MDAARRQETQTREKKSLAGKNVRQHLDGWTNPSTPSFRTGRSSLWLPQIVRLLRVGLERQFHLASRTCGFVCGEDRFQCGSPIFAGNQRLFVVLDAVNKMRHFLRKAII